MEAGEELIGCAVCDEDEQEAEEHAPAQETAHGWTRECADRL
jgi:hypothetical protein